MKLEEAVTLALDTLVQHVPHTEEKREAANNLSALIGALGGLDGAAIRHAVTSVRVATLKNVQSGIEQEIQHVDAAPREHRDKAKAHRLHQQWQEIEAKIEALRAEAVR